MNVYFLAALTLTSCALSQVQLVTSGPGVWQISKPFTFTYTISRNISSGRHNWNWVRHAPGRWPEWMGRIYPFGNKTSYAPSFHNRANISANSSTNQISLQLHSLTVADTATYYCTERPMGGWDTDKLIFGSGTRLQVEPKSDPTPPSVLLMKSKATSGKQVKAACLAKDFYPKEVKMNFVNSSPVYEQDDPVLSQNGKYNTIKVVQIDDTEDVACSVDYQGKQYSAKATKPAAEQPMTMPTTFCAPSNSTAAEENPEKVNMLSMTVLALRVLFAKTIAFNTLMTIKLFVF